MLYTLITFVGLFIIAATAAVVLYVKFEDRRTMANQAERDLEEFAKKAERTRITSIVGAKQPHDSWFATMRGYLNNMVATIVGPSKDTSVEEKVNTVNRKVQEIKQRLAREYVDIEFVDPNTAGLTQIIEKLETNLNNVTQAALESERQLNELQNKFDDAMADMNKTQKRLSEERDQFKRQVDRIKQEYDKLAALLNKNKDQQVQDLRAELDQMKDARDKLETELLQMGAKLTYAEERIAHLQTEIQAIMPFQDPNVLAYRPDGKIIVIDNKIVHLDIGRDDHVYQGLTFTVYDRGMPIPKDGIGKAEIEVFDVRQNFSAARVLYSEKTNPIVQDDIVANLIWDSKRTNLFMVAGEFDLNRDGDFDYDAPDRIKALIVRWGGKVTNAVTVDTDYLVLGRPPRILRKPTFDEIEEDPLAMQKYEASLREFDYYKQVQAQARTLYIPVFNTERFLYFIGYRTQATRPGAFY
jgi:predicted  nucleic acid-binding Zn-ribbon protein